MQDVYEQGSCAIHLTVNLLYIIILYWSEGICNESSIIALSYALPAVGESSL